MIAASAAVLLLLLSLIGGAQAAAAAPGVGRGMIRTVSGNLNVASSAGQSTTQVPDYNASAAINYAWMVHNLYFHKAEYPAAVNTSIMQKNLDYYNSEDCAHFVSEGLIAGGLTILASNPPGDNLTGYDNGQFVGSYGIVGAYRLADYLAGYDLPVFPLNATAESTLGYYPIPGSYQGTPHTAVYYVENYSMMPSFFLSPGDVIVDGGAGSGHVMLYIGGGNVLQTDPALEWAYLPGDDQNISFYGLATLNGQNVTALYLHMPTFSRLKSVNITAISPSGVLASISSHVRPGTAVTLIGSFPDGVGYGNYTFTWLDNGKVISGQQNFTFRPGTGTNDFTLYSNGSAGSAVASYTITVSGSSRGISETTIVLAAAGAFGAAVAAVLLIRSARKK